MQIIIDLHAGNPGEEQNIQSLLQKLTEAGYSIQEGQTFEAYQTQAKLLVADTKTKRFYFLNSYFPVVYGFMTQAERPASPKRVLGVFSSLIYENDKELLHSIYHEEYLDFQARGLRKVAEQN